MGAVPAMAALRVLFQPNLAPEETLAAEIHLESDSYRLQATPTQLHIEQGFLKEAPLVLYAKPKSLISLASGLLTVDDAQQANVLQIARGNVASVEHFFAQFALPETG